MAVAVGSRVFLIGGVAVSNGADVAPATVTRAWTPDMVNLTAFPDAGAPAVATSIQLFDTEDEARAWIDAEAYRSTAACYALRP